MLDLKEIVQLEIQQMRSMPDGIISEIVHEVAFGENSPLGHSLLCSPERLDYFVEHNSLKKFVNKHFLGSRMVVSAVGVDHDEVALCFYLFGCTLSSLHLTDLF